MNDFYHKKHSKSNLAVFFVNRKEGLKILPQTLPQNRSGYALLPKPFA
jgi:hypothetical protein